jgi:serine/threonine-protein kinase
MSLDEAWRILEAVASALEYAHRQGMVHRDIKPANVMLTSKGDVVLTDFGIARIVGATQYTATGAVVGTPAYLSPEQGKGERGDERSDIYALGVVLYEMVTGQVPFDADTPLAVIFQHISDPLPLPRQLNPDVPEPVERVILQALAKEPDERYQTVPEMIGALKAALAGSDTETVDAVFANDVEMDEPALEYETESQSLWDDVHTDDGARRGSGKRARQDVRLSGRAWKGVALALFVLALSWGACGLLVGAVPSEPTENMPNPESTNFWITRGCFLGPAFALLFLAYMSVVAGRREGRAVRCSEMVTVLGVALGLVPILLGAAIALQPAPDAGDRVIAPLMCAVPGLFIIGLAAVFWTLVVRSR